MGTLYQNCDHQHSNKRFLAVKNFLDGRKVVQYGSFCASCEERLLKDNQVLKSTKEESMWLFSN